MLPDAKPKICVTPNANPRRQPVEYRWRWVFWRWPCIFHVYFMYISCCLCTIFRVGYARIGRRKAHIFNSVISLIDGAKFIKFSTLVVEGHLEGIMSQIFYLGLKPIFHQNAKYLASGGGVGQCPRRQTFALGIPTCWYILALPPTPTPDASQWNIGGVGSSGVGAGVGHVHFMLFMSIPFASGTQCKPVFWWNMGFRFYLMKWRK